tara:strand:+ start:272 stop:664 length:393 start_codon:yes stop_codon:yes gene_type:complete
MGFVLGLLMLLGIGPYDNLVKTFKHEDVKHMKTFVDGPIIVRAEGKTIIMDKKAILEYFDLVFKNCVVTNVKLTRPLKAHPHFIYMDEAKYRKKRLVMLRMDLTDLNDGYTLSNTMFIDIYKRKIVEISM